MLSREFKGMSHKCYVCRVYVDSACVQVYKHLCMESSLDISMYVMHVKLFMFSSCVNHYLYLKTHIK